MGTFLSKPVTDHETDEGSRADGLSYGVSAMQGWRSGMEDAHLTNLEYSSDWAVFGVFDGHGGPEVAKYCAAHLCEILEQHAPNPGTDELGGALQKSFLELDTLISSAAGIKELKQFSKDAAKHKKNAVPMITLEEAAEAAEAYGLTLQQFQALIASQINARMKASEKEEEEEEDAKREESTSDAVDATTTQHVTVATNNSDQHSTEEEATSEPESPTDPTSIVIETVSSPSSSSEDDDEDGEKQSDDTSANKPPRRRGVGVESGATAVVAVLSGSHVVVANAGDSRCVLARNGTSVDLSEDHKPEDEIELTRIEKAGGSVVEGRVEGNLNLSRAIGDLHYKRNDTLDAKDQMITAFPDITEIAIQPNDDFLVLACDGIWNVLTSDEVIKFVYDHLKQGEALGSICEKMCDRCLAPDTDNDGTGCDNMTMMVVLLPAGSTKFIPGSSAKRKLDDCNEPPSKCAKHDQ